MGLWRKLAGLVFLLVAVSPVLLLSGCGSPTTEQVPSGESLDPEDDPALPGNDPAMKETTAPGNP